MSFYRKGELRQTLRRAPLADGRMASSRHDNNYMDHVYRAMHDEAPDDPTEARDGDYSRRRCSFHVLAWLDKRRNEEFKRDRASKARMKRDLGRLVRTSRLCLHLRAVVLWLFCEKWLTLGEDDILTKFAADHLGEHDTWLGMDRIPGDPITDPDEMVNAPLKLNFRTEQPQLPTCLQYLIVHMYDRSKNSTYHYRPKVEGLRHVQPAQDAITAGWYDPENITDMSNQTAAAYTRGMRQAEEREGDDDSELSSWKGDGKWPATPFRVSIIASRDQLKLATRRQKTDAQNREQWVAASRRRLECVRTTLELLMKCSARDVAKALRIPWKGGHPVEWFVDGKRTGLSLHARPEDEDSDEEDSNDRIRLLRDRLAAPGRNMSDVAEELHAKASALEKTEGGKGSIAVAEQAVAFSKKEGQVSPGEDEKVLGRVSEAMHDMLKWWAQATRGVCYKLQDAKNDDLPAWEADGTASLKRTKAREHFHFDTLMAALEAAHVIAHDVRGAGAPYGKVCSCYECSKRGVCEHCVAFCMEDAERLGTKSWTFQDKGEHMVDAGSYSHRPLESLRRDGAPDRAAGSGGCYQNDVDAKKVAAEPTRSYTPVKVTHAHPGGLNGVIPFESPGRGDASVEDRVVEFAGGRQITVPRVPAPKLGDKDYGEGWDEPLRQQIGMWDQYCRNPDNAPSTAKKAAEEEAEPTPVPKKPAAKAKPTKAPAQAPKPSTKPKPKPAAAPTRASAPKRRRAQKK